MLESFNIRGGGGADNQQVTKQPNGVTAKVFQKFSNISDQNRQNATHKNQKPRSVGGVR